MKTYEGTESYLENPRSHPWTVAETNSRYKYSDFKAEPHLIRTSLEDFVPWSHWQAISTFYTLLEWLNGPHCAFESNDSVFNGPHKNNSLEFSKLLVCSGRLMVLYRHLPLNLSRLGVEGLETSTHHSLISRDPEFLWGVIGTTIMPTRYITLPLSAEAQLGYQLMLSFWAWGDSRVEVMAHLERVFRNLGEALRHISSTLVCRH